VAEYEGVKITAGAYDEPTVDCPWCGAPGCECDWVDVGVGSRQCGPYHCDNCGASEIGPEAYNKDMKCDATPEELRRGWYGPARPVSPCANTVQGTLVDHKTAKVLYDLGLLDKKETP
jgi:hypothetical protein